MLSFALRCKLSSVLPLVRAQQLRRGQTAIFESIPSASVKLWVRSLPWDHVDVGPKLTCRPVQLNPQIICSSLCPSASPSAGCFALPPPLAPQPAPAPPPAARPAPPLPPCAYAPRLIVTPTTFLRRHGWGARHLLDPRRGLLPCARPERSKVGAAGAI